MAIKDKCTICNESSLGLLTKCSLILNIGFRCKNCKAKYVPENRIFPDKMVFGFKFLINVIDFILSILWFPMIVLMIYFFMNSLKIAIILSFLFITFTLLFIKFRPYRLDESNSMNDRIKRIEEAKKNKVTP